MKKINIPLLAGCFILFIVVLVALFPGFFTDGDPNYQSGRMRVHEKEVDGEMVRSFEQAPHAPNNENLFGTDDLGRDLYSRIIYGTRTTLRFLFLATLCRFLLAVPIGTFAGVGVKPLSKLIHVFSSLFAFLPTLIISYIVLNISYIGNLPLSRAMPIFLVFFTIIGWGKLAKQIEQKTANLMMEDFIEGEIAVGKHLGQILYQNLTPHLIPYYVSWFFLEMGLVLFLVSQLAILGVFIGNRQAASIIDDVPGWYTSLDPEWSSLFYRVRENIANQNYWLVFFPSMAIFITLTSLNLIGEGLKEEFEKRNSPVVSLIWKGILFLSPKTFIEQLKNWRCYRKPIIVKSFILIFLIGFILYPKGQSPYDFDSQRAMEHYENILSLEDQEAVQQYIASHLQANGLIPQKEENYLFDQYHGLSEFEIERMQRDIDPRDLAISELKEFGFSGPEIHRILNVEKLPTDRLNEGREKFHIILQHYEESAKDPETLMGIMPGKNWDSLQSVEEHKNEEVITLIGTRYDRLFVDEGHPSASRRMGIANLLALIETLNEIEEPFEETMIFIFWDGKGSILNQESPQRYLQNPIFPSHYTSYRYYDLGYLPTRARDELLITIHTSRTDSYRIQELLVNVEDRIKRNDMSSFLMVNNQASGAVQQLYYNAQFAVGVGEDYYEFLDTADDNLENLSLEFVKDQGQLILDLLIMME